MELKWEAVLENIKTKISKPSFETWIAKTTIEVEDDVVFVKANNDFQAEWLDTRYKTLIFESIKEVLGHTMEVEIGTDKNKPLTWTPSEDSSYPNAYEELKGIIKVQQEKIDKLEERINYLEQSIKNIGD